jgi:putative two-component system response regulator
LRVTNPADGTQDGVRRQVVLVVDDEEAVRTFFERLLTSAGYHVRLAEDGTTALTSVLKYRPDVVLLDVQMPDMNGVEVCRRLRNNAVTRLIPVVFVTGFNAREQRIEGLEAGADDFLVKPVDTQELLARVRSLTRMKQFTDDLDSAASIIMTLATMIEARDGYGEGHCSRSANYATSLGRAMKLSDADLHALHRGGFLHDIGMLAIPDAVLRKSGPLSAREFELVRSHTIIGDRLCSNLRSLQAVRPIVRHHHERLDGSGYPDGLQGDQIPLLAQIMGIIDTYEALTSVRPYQTPKSPDEALEVLQEHVARGWRRRDLVDQFVAIIQRGSQPAFLGVPRPQPA